MFCSFFILCFVFYLLTFLFSIFCCYFFRSKVNLQWSKRYSALFYPREGAEITYKDTYKFITTTSKETYIRSHRFNAKTFEEGEIEDKGNKLDSKPKKKFLNIKSGSLIFSKKRGGEELLSIDLRNSDVALICNDVLKKTPDNINWFVIFSKDKQYILRSANTPELESWCRALLQFTPFFNVTYKFFIFLLFLFYFFDSLSILKLEIKSKNLRNNILLLLCAIICVNMPTICSQFLKESLCLEDQLLQDPKLNQKPLKNLKT